MKQKQQEQEQQLNELNEVYIATKKHQIYSKREKLQSNFEEKKK